jgi:aryl-alcohol dehydrogenase-like predicted oxidoreductase
MNMNSYVTLGRSGLKVSPLCLGTMTFGTEWGWGSEEKDSKTIFDRYLEAGGNFLDTADGYTMGHSEQLVGKFVAERKLRDNVVIATKFTFNGQQGNPNAGGNGRKNIYRALEGSLSRLQTDYVDLYWLHAWDTVTPVEEVLSTLNDLVREGKILHFGFSDTPAWYVARAQTLAQAQGKEPLIALQLEYSLAERNIEREHIPVAQELGIAICPWSPLASGLLSGKYKREGNSGSGDGRLQQTKDQANPVFRKFSERNWQIVEVLANVSKQIGKSPAQVALNWVATQPGVTSTIIGATKTSQLDANLASLDFTIPVDLRKQLNEASALEIAHPYLFFTEGIQQMINGGKAVRPWEPARATGAPLGAEAAPTLAMKAQK